MKEETKKQVRISIVGLFGFIALILMVSEPTNQDTWFRDFFISKLIAAVFGFITYRLAKYWESKGLLPEMDEDI